MRILFVSHAHLRKELGASKVLMELSEEMSLLGWDCELVGLPHLVPAARRRRDYAEGLRDYLRKNAGGFDVVDYDHCYLPYGRAEFPLRSLFVARSVLLAHHLKLIKVPKRWTLKATIRSLLLPDGQLSEACRRAQATLMEADLVNVANHHDEATLIRSGIPPEKIAVFPYGLSRERQSLFDELPATAPDGQRVAFVGTFDDRKGASDFPKIVEKVLARVPECSFRLLGTITSPEGVVRQFPPRLRERIEVIPTYPAMSLPTLLAPCSLGIFPSYIEGFGFGVLEMLAAGLPVVAYDAPGPPMMLPAQYLTTPGDTTAMSEKIIGLLTDRSELLRARAWARERARQFSWREIARQTSDVYRARLQAKRGDG